MNRWNNPKRKIARRLALSRTVGNASRQASVERRHACDRGALVGGLHEGERVFHLALPRGVLPERVAFGVDPLLVQHHEFLGDLADGGSHLALGLGEVAPAEAVQRRCLAADVLAQRVDLVGRYVQLVAALVRHEQVVTFDPADRALDHALVLADAVLVVHDVHAGLEILERRRPLALAGPGGTAGPATTGQVGLGDDGQLGVRQVATPVQGCDDDRSAGCGRGLVADGEVELVVEQDLPKSCSAAGAVGGDDDAVACREQVPQPVGEPGAVAADRPPTARLDDRGVGRFGRRVDRPERADPAEQLVRFGVQAGELLVRVARPGRRERLREVGLLGEQVGGAVAHASGLDEQDLGRVGQHVGEQHVVVDEPGHPRLHAVEVSALGELLPLLASPRLGTDQLLGASADLGGRHELAGGEDQRLVEVGLRALVVDPEGRQAVDLVAPQVDADRRVGRRRVDVDDRAATGELAPVLDQLLAAVAELDELRDEPVGVDDRLGSHDDRFDLGGVRTELLEQGPHAGDDDPWAALRPVAHTPQHLEPLPHRLDGGTDTFERQRLPRGEQCDRVVTGELAHVVEQLPGHRTGRAGDDQRTALRQMGEGGDRDRACHLDDRQARIRLREGAGQARFVPQQRRQSGQAHQRLLYRFIATSMPSATIASTASAASAIVTSSSSRWRAGTRVSTWLAPRSLFGGLPTPIRTRR